MKKIIVSFALLGLSVTAASAHVLLARKEAAPGSSYKAVLSVPHSCPGSPTVKLRVKIPEGFIAVKPMVKLIRRLILSQG